MENVDSEPYQHTSSFAELDQYDSMETPASLPEIENGGHNLPFLSHDPSLEEPHASAHEEEEEEEASEKIQDDESGKGSSGSSIQAQPPIIIIPSLAVLARKVVAEYFVVLMENKPFLDTLRNEDREVVLSEVKDVPLKMAILQIPDDSYWKRRCTNEYCIPDNTDREGRWKYVYAQTYIQGKIEAFHPTHSDYDELKDDLRLCSDYVNELNIGQLRLPERKCEFEELKEDDAVSSWDRINWTEIARHLPNLEQFSVTYAVGDCGLDYDRKMFNITDNDFVTLNKCFDQWPKLRVFRLKHSTLNDEQVLYLVCRLVSHKVLEVLDLRHNSIGDEGAKALARLLVSSPTLLKLILLNNYIADEGAKHLATALKHNTQLQCLNLAMNEIGDEGAIAICRALRTNNTLRKLSLAGNRLKVEGGMAFVHMIKSTHNLTHLDLSANELSPEVGLKMANAIRTNERLVFVDVRLCSFVKTTERIIRSIMSKRITSYDTSSFL